MNSPGIEHIFFIPGVLLIGMVIGYVMGARAARAEFERARERARR
jgi:proteasome assembly chaperone (PAC2) family protein